MKPAVRSRLWAYLTRTLPPLLLAGLLGAAGLAGPSPAQALGQPLPPSPQESQALASLKGKLPGEIVFASKREGKWRLFRMDADGANLVRLSSAAANERRPHWTMGGSKLVFESDRAGRVQVWMAEPDLSSPRCLSPAGQEEWLHGITSNGRLLLVRRDPSPQGYLLRDLTSGQETRLDLSAINARQGRGHVQLSPDGKRVGFFFDPQGAGQAGRGVYWMELGPGGKTHDAWQASEGCGTGWRPDSQAFLMSRQTGNGTDLWSVDAQHRVQRLTGGRDWDYFGEYGPEGKWMAWGLSPLDQHSFDTGNYEIHILGLTGNQPAQPVRLTFHSAPDLEPAWRAQKGQALSRGEERIYEAELFQHAPGQVKERGDASEGRAVLVPAGQAGVAIWGQYDRLPAGRYRALFVLRLAGAGSDQPAALLDVAAQGQVLGQRQVKGNELNPDAWTRLEVDFELSQAGKDLECRVKALPGHPGLWVDFIQVGPPAPPPPPPPPTAKAAPPAPAPAAAQTKPAVEPQPGLWAYLGRLARATFGSLW